MSTTTIAPALGLDNPVVDPQWYAGEMSNLQSKLSSAFPTVPREVVAAALELASQRLAVPARIPNYLPVLVERDVRAQLAVYLRAPTAP